MAAMPALSTKEIVRLYFMQPAVRTQPVSPGRRKAGKDVLRCKSLRVDVLLLNDDQGKLL